MQHPRGPSLTARDFRQFPALETEPRHWLLDSVYGRQLLKARLRQHRHDIRVTMLLEQPELDPVLNTMIDLMDLREWPRPASLSQRLWALRIQLGMSLDIHQGRSPISWR